MVRHRCFLSGIKAGLFKQAGIPDAETSMNTRIVHLCLAVCWAVLLLQVMQPAQAQRSNDNFYWQQQQQRQQQAAAEQARRQQEERARAERQRQMQLQQEQMRQRQQEMQRQARERQQRLQAEQAQMRETQRLRNEQQRMAQGQRQQSAVQSQAQQQQALQHQRVAQQRQEQLTRLRQDRERLAGAQRQQRDDATAHATMRARLAAQTAAARANTQASQDRQRLTRDQLNQTRLSATLQQQRDATRQKLAGLQQTQRRITDTTGAQRQPAPRADTPTRIASAKVFSSCSGGKCEPCKSSFHGDTLVLTKKGSAPIQSLVAGKDWVWAKNKFTGEGNWKAVTERHSNSYGETVEISIASGNGQTAQTLKSNRSHPFFVGATPSDGGDDGAALISGAVVTPRGEWITAENLRPGHRLLESDGEWAAVASVAIKPQPLKAFNLTVADFNTFFVSAPGSTATNAVWVHNCDKNDNRLNAERAVKKVRGPVFDGLKDHAARHSRTHPNTYYNAAVRHLKTGEKFTFRHDGQFKSAFVTRTGPNSFTFTSASKSGNRIFTHISEVSAQYLENIGITLPKGF
jgi:hypothetical protein